MARLKNKNLYDYISDIRNSSSLEKYLENWKAAFAYIESISEEDYFITGVQQYFSFDFFEDTEDSDDFEIIFPFLYKNDTIKEYLLHIVISKILKSDDFSKKLVIYNTIGYKELKNYFSASSSHLKIIESIKDLSSR